MTPLKQVQPAMAFAAVSMEADLSLEALADQTGLSAFHMHRRFSEAAGETPKQFTSRLRLDRAAAMLLTTTDSVLSVALACGFQSHEVFCRAFRKRFQMTPSSYRARGFASCVDRDQAAAHADLVSSVGPCVGLIRRKQPSRDRKGAGPHYEDGRSSSIDMEYTITKKTLAPQPVLVVRRRVKPDEIAKTLGAALGQVFLHAQQNGIAMAGHPFMRYIEWGPGLWTTDIGLPVAAHAGAASGDVRADTLPGGPAAVTTHTGPYDQLIPCHAVVQQWIETQGLKAAGAPWELYVTDPADYPDPKDWKTEIYWPLT
jgi:AraC-like DNA-binding protein/effector-binding domain-containing protein